MSGSSVINGGEPENLRIKAHLPARGITAATKQCEVSQYLNLITVTFNTREKETPTNLDERTHFHFITIIDTAAP